MDETQRKSVWMFWKFAFPVLQVLVGLFCGYIIGLGAGKRVINEKIRSGELFHRAEIHRIEIGETVKPGETLTGKLSLKSPDGRQLVVVGTPEVEASFDCRFCGKEITFKKKMRMKDGVYTLDGDEHKCPHCEKINDTRKPESE